MSNERRPRRSAADDAPSHRGKVATGRPQNARHGKKDADDGGWQASGAVKRPPRPRPAAGRPERQPARDAALAGGPSEPMRIAKAMARAGLCSRRDAERWIADGRVSVNGQLIRSPALDVGPDDRVIVDGRPLPGAEPPKLWRYHKPRGLVTTHRDPEGRETVFDKLPATLGRVISIGRLDVTSEGLLLLTNDGELARHLELPATGWLRRYRVRAHGRVTPEALERLASGIEVEGVKYGPIEATLDKEQGANVWLTLGLREGKNREVRKVLGALGLDVNRLIRISYGPFQLLELPPGEVEAVRRRVLVEQLGPTLARELGLMDQADADRERRTRARDDTRAGRGGAKGAEPAPGDDGDAGEDA